MMNEKLFLERPFYGWVNNQKLQCWILISWYEGGKTYFSPTPSLFVVAFISSTTLGCTPCVGASIWVRASCVWISAWPELFDSWNGDMTVCGITVCAPVLGTGVVPVFRVTHLTPVSAPAMATPELVALLDVISPTVVAEVGTCIDRPAALEKNGVPPGWTRGSSCVPDVDTCCGVMTGMENESGRGDVWAGDDNDERADSAARGDGMGKRLEGVRGVVRVGVVGGRVSGAMPMGLPGTAVTWWGVVDVEDAVWLKVAVARVAKVSRTLESCDLVVALVVLLPSEFTKKDEQKAKIK